MTGVYPQPFDLFNALGHANPDMRIPDDDEVRATSMGWQ